MSQVYTDPEALEVFLRHLQRFRQVVAEADERIGRELMRLRLEWRDEGYEAFVSSYLKTRQRLQDLNRVIEEVTSHLRRDIETLRAYLAASLPSGAAPDLGAVPSAGEAAPSLGVAASSGGAPQLPGITMFPLPEGFQWVRVEDLPSPYPETPEPPDPATVEMGAHLTTVLNDLFALIGWKNEVDIASHFERLDQERDIPPDRGARRLYETLFGSDRVTAHYDPQQDKWHVYTGGRTLRMARQLGWEWIPVYILK